MKDFAEIFGLGINFFSTRGASITLSEFKEDTAEAEVDFSLYECSKYMLCAMIGLKPANEEEEREAILAALD